MAWSLERIVIQEHLEVNALLPVYKILCSEVFLHGVHVLSEIHVSGYLFRISKYWKLSNWINRLSKCVQKTGCALAVEIVHGKEKGRV